MEEIKNVLYVDDEEAVRRSLQRCLVGQPFKLDLADSREKAMEMVRRTKYAVIAVDLHLAGQGSGLILIDTLRAAQPEAAYMLVSGKLDVDTTIEAVNKHHVDFVLRKPWTLSEVIATFERSLEASRELAAKSGALQELTHASRAWSEEKDRLTRALTHVGTQFTETLMQTLTVRGHETPSHCRRVAAYTLAIARQLGVPAADLEALQTGALLHDLGKVTVPDYVFSKREALSKEEWDLIRKHPDVGARMLDGIPSLAAAKLLVQQHHERWDGTGYPRGLKGEEICLGARIFAVADAVDAMCTPRAYRPVVTLDEALREINSHAGRYFDAHVVLAWARVPPDYAMHVMSKYIDYPAAPVDLK